MKHQQQFIIILLCFFITLVAWADSTLQVRTNGITGIPKKNVDNTLQNLKAKMKYPFTQASVYEFYQKAPTEIKKALEPYGYFHAQIRSYLAHQNNAWFTTFNINTGPQMSIAHIDLKITGEGAYNPAFLHLMEHFPLKVNQSLDTEKYENTKRLLFDRASELGYFNARMIKSKIIINLITYQASIIIHFDTGVRYQFGPTTFSSTAYNINFLRRYLTYREQEYYSYKKIQDTQEGLTNSGYFQEVILIPSPDSITHKVPIHIQLVPRNSQLYIVGIGYGTDTGPRGTLSVHLRRLNAYGHRFNAELEASKTNSSLAAHYIIPGPRPAKNQFTITAAVGHLDIPIGKSRSGKIALSYTTAFGELKQTASLTYLDEKYNIQNQPNINARLLFPNFNWNIVHTTNETPPQNGYLASLNIAGTTGNLTQSGNGFIQEELTTKGLITFKTHTRLLLRTTWGRTDIKNLDNLPLSLQLFAGGAQSVRGFTYNSIGPGRNLFVGSVEIQQRVMGRWYVATFFDAGNVSNQNPFKELRAGIGPAIVLLLPVGSLEISLAKPMILQNNRWRFLKHWRIQFSMGPVL